MWHYTTLLSGAGHWSFARQANWSQLFPSSVYAIPAVTKRPAVTLPAVISATLCDFLLFLPSAAHQEGKVTLHDQGIVCTANVHTEHIT